MILLIGSVERGNNKAYIGEGSLNSGVTMKTKKKRGETEGKDKTFIYFFFFFKCVY